MPGPNRRYIPIHSGAPKFNCAHIKSEGRPLRRPLFVLRCRIPLIYRKERDRGGTPIEGGLILLRQAAAHPGAFQAWAGAIFLTSERFARDSWRLVRPHERPAAAGNRYTRCWLVPTWAAPSLVQAGALSVSQPPTPTGRASAGDGEIIDLSRIGCLRIRIRTLTNSNQDTRGQIRTAPHSSKEHIANTEQRWYKPA